VSAYDSPAAFRRALTDRLGALAESGPWELQQLQRQFAYDRLLERLYLMDDGWILKGAVALLARNIGVRASLDIDVFRAKSLDAAEADVREAASRDIGDWFRFELGPRGPIGERISGARYQVRAYVGASVWAGFRVDLVGPEVAMIGEPEAVAAIAPLGLPDVPQRGYRPSACRPRRRQARRDIRPLWQPAAAVDALPGPRRPRGDIRGGIGRR
jgi:hypothetical protein